MKFELPNNKLHRSHPHQKLEDITQSMTLSPCLFAFPHKVWIQSTCPLTVFALASFLQLAGKLSALCFVGNRSPPLSVQ
jgi:hypothetical protein